jgi:hypothetical protein
MSTLNPTAVTARRASVSVPAAAPALESVAIRWSVSRRALRESKRPPAMTLAEQGPELDLCWELDLESGQGRAVLCDPATGARQTLAQAPVRWTADQELIHIEARDNAEMLLLATLRVEGDAARVLYARSPLLAALGLGGGRYEVAL